MRELRCVVMRGLPKEVEEQVNKFLEATPCTIEHVLQSESSDHITLTLFYTLDAHLDLEPDFEAQTRD